MRNPQPRKPKRLDEICRPNILQLNIEGLTVSKIWVVSQLATKHEAQIILLQETHCTIPDRLEIPNFTLASATFSRIQGLVTFIHDRLQCTLTDQSHEEPAIEWICVDVNGLKVINIYKPPTAQLSSTFIPTHAHPCLYAGDFSCQHADWSYASIRPDGVYLVDWANKNGLDLLHNPKDAPSFFSGRWNSGTNPDLPFLSLGRDSNRSHDKCVLEKFPRSQHRPSLITALKMVAPVPSAPCKR